LRVGLYEADSRGNSRCNVALLSSSRSEIILAILLQNGLLG
jgi:hypothetical protein